MAAFFALYPKPDEDVEGFEKHYRDEHMATVADWPNVVSAKVYRVTGTPRGDEAPFHLAFVAEFDSDEALGEAMRSEGMGRSAADARTMLEQWGIAPVMLVAEDL